MGTRGIMIYSSLIWDNIWSHSHELTSLLAKDFHVYYLEVPKNSAKGHEHLIPKKKHPVPKNVTLLTPEKEFKNFGPAYFVYTQKETIKFFLEHRDDFDIFITYNTYDIILLRLAKLYNKKIIFMYVDEYEELTPNKLFKSMVSRNLKIFLKRSDAVICTARILEEKAKMYNTNVYYLPNAVRISDFKSSKNIMYPSKHSGYFTVGFVGSLGEWIDIELIIETAIFLSKKYTKIRFQIIGSGPGEEILKMALKRNKLKNIDILGFMDRQSALKQMHAFDVAIIPFKINKITNSVSPVKLFEYWMTGNPVIATRTNELKQFSREILFIGNDSMKDLIIRLYRNPGLRKRLAEAGRELVLKKYNWEGYENVYEKIIRNL